MDDTTIPPPRLIGIGRRCGALSFAGVREVSLSMAAKVRARGGSV